MSSFGQVLRSSPQSAPLRVLSLSNSAHGRSPAYRRLLSSPALARASHETRLSSALLPLSPAPLRSQFLPSTLRLEPFSRAEARLFHYSARTSQRPSPEDAKARPKPSSEAEAEQKAESAPEEQAKGQEEVKSEEGKTEEGKTEEGEKDGKEESDKKEKKEDLPPPPPHGDKTPWQVFMETMQTELKDSKEWNESTKALASSAHQFSESESVRKARQAYDATTGAVTNTASTVVKSTAGAIGKGAAWTWETPVMKGVRKGANITGEALDKATKPIRETEAYKNVKDVIDDGSSSRYGGWVDKEERKRRREMQEQADLKDGTSRAVHQEDPE